MLPLLKVSKDTAKKISKVRNEQGAFSCIDRKTRKKISEETIEKVKQFYLSPLYSKIMPGQYDTVFSDKDTHGNKERVAKHQMLVTLAELHSEFLQQNSENKISASLRKCDLANVAGFGIRANIETALVLYTKTLNYYWNVYVRTRLDKKPIK